MSSSVWAVVADKEASGTLLALCPDGIYRLRFNKRKAVREEMPTVAQGLASGRLPTEFKFEEKNKEFVPYQAIQRIDVPASLAKVKFTVFGEGKTSTLEFEGSEKTDQVEIAREAVARGRLPLPEQTIPIDADSALVRPGIAMAIVLGVLGLLYGIAVSEPDQDGGRRKAIAALLEFVARSLGPTGVIGIGIVAVLIVIGYTAMRLKNRPQRLAWVSPDMKDA